MTPCLTPNNRIDGVLANAVLGCNSALSNLTACHSASNVQHVSLPQHGTSGALTTHLPLGMEARPVAVTAGRSPFGFGVTVVVGSCAEPQVSRVDARRVVTIRAIVQHLQTVRDRAISKFPCEAMRGVNLRPTLVPNAVMPVSVGINTSAPKPAIARLVNAGPVIFKLFRGILGVHGNLQSCDANPRPLQRRGDFSLPQLYQIGVR